METKKCPYCGGEIMLAAKKCKHCGEWLEEQAKSIHSSEPIKQVNHSPDENINQHKIRNIVFLVIGVIILSILIWLVVAVNNKVSATERYNERHAILNRNDYCILKDDGQKIWYVHRITDTYGILRYDSTMSIYDSTTDRQTDIDLNRTSMDGSWEFDVEDIVERNGIITIIMSENRNSNGWVVGTYVWQYDCANNSWNPLAKACSGAKFIDNYTAVRIAYADCINPNDCTAAQRYTYTYDTIQL